MTHKPAIRKREEETEEAPPVVTPVVITGPKIEGWNRFNPCIRCADGFNAISTKLNSDSLFDNIVGGVLAISVVVSAVGATVYFAPAGIAWGLGGFALGAAGSLSLVSVAENEIAGVVSMLADIAKFILNEMKQFFLQVYQLIYDRIERFSSLAHLY